MAQFLKSVPATREHPCPLCGKTDHCWSADYGQDGWLYYCAKTSYEAVTGSDGREYILKNNRRFPDGRCEGYWVYETKEQQERQREEYIAKLKASNPNYKGGNGSKHYTKRPVAAQEIRPQAVEIDRVTPLANERLDMVYRRLLELLVLEPNHQRALLSEWDAGLSYPDLGERILKRYPIRSLPESDYARKNSGDQLKNKTRHEICKTLAIEFGSLEGVPGFYQKTVRYLDKVTGEPVEYTVWDMIPLSGIVYPVYDSKGLIYRLRIGDEHPSLQEYARDASGKYVMYPYETQVRNADGSITTHVEQKHSISADIQWDRKTGEWYRIDRSSKQKTIIYSRQQGISTVAITDKGYPKIDGKVDGKYKNFSSYFRKEEQRGEQWIAYNSYFRGCQSGSQVSLISKPGDDMQYLYITEGEKKAIVINMILNCPVVALPGVSTFRKLFEPEYKRDKSMIQTLIDRGLVAVIVVYDADKSVNESVLGAEEGLVEMCHNAGVYTYVGEWNPHYGKGADDILIAGKQFDYEER